MKSFLENKFFPWISLTCQYCKERLRCCGCKSSAFTGLYKLFFGLFWMFFLTHWPCAYCRLFFFKPKFVFATPCPSRGGSGNPRAYWTVFFLPVKERLKEAPFMALEKIGQYPRDWNEWREKAARDWKYYFISIVANGFNWRNFSDNIWWDN